MELNEVEITVPWGTVAAKSWGNPKNYPVLMIHGVQDNAGSFDNLIPLLPNTFFYISIDLPGHGNSSHYPLGITFNSTTYVTCIKYVVTFLNWEKFHFICHSFGGGIATYFAATFPKMVTKLVLIDSSVQSYPENEIAKKFSDYINGLLKIEQMSSSDFPVYSYEEAVERILKKRKISEEGAKVLLRRSLVPCEGGFRFTTDQRLKLSYDAFYTLEQNKNFGDRIECPIVSIVSSETTLLLPERLNSSIKCTPMGNAQFIIVDGGHSVHIDNPGVIAPIICRFFGQFKSNL